MDIIWFVFAFYFIAVAMVLRFNYIAGKWMEDLEDEEI